MEHRVLGRLLFSFSISKVSGLLGCVVGFSVAGVTFSIPLAPDSCDGALE